MARATEVIPLYSGDDWATLEELRMDAVAADTRLEQAQKSPNRLGGNGGDLKAAAEEAWRIHDEFVDEAAERAEEVVVQSLGRRAFRDLRLAHKPRTTSRLVEGEQTEIPVAEDGLYGINVETFPDALLSYISEDDHDERTILQPKFNGKAELQKWLDDELSEGQYDTIWTTAYGLNRRGALDLKELRSRPRIQTSSETPA